MAINTSNTDHDKGQPQLYLFVRTRWRSSGRQPLLTVAEHHKMVFVAQRLNASAITRQAL